MQFLLFIVGLVLLIVGAEALVRGASRLAALFGISPLVIGLTVVAFGTSSPELAVSIKAALSEQGDIALGNVIGSNIFNVLFILGLSALIVPLTVARQLIRLDVPLMIGLSIAVWLCSLDQQLGRTDGLLLLLGLGLYIGFMLYQSRHENNVVTAEYNQEFGTGGSSWGKNLILIVIGLSLLVLGSRWLVSSAVAFAQYLGVSELVIGLTIIAAGTSLPEVVTSIIAALRNQRDIAVGNVVGSNIFNLMGVLGCASIVAPDGIFVSDAMLRFDFAIMAVVAFACLPLFFTGYVISRLEGLLLLGYYVIYTAYLILAANHHQALPWWSNTMLYFVVPLTFLTIVLIALREKLGKSN